jgi:hypothetical protein
MVPVVHPGALTPSKSPMVEMLGSVGKNGLRTEFSYHSDEFPKEIFVVHEFTVRKTKETAFRDTQDTRRPVLLSTPDLHQIVRL